ncbi:FAD-linked oxidoreductase-like protein [Kockovaella imperatae]|uniref:Proline dehydrogenase n=1 Tax=Kockovaella imperatae TaxID=4999 RepID=A0A1Y1UMD9_9TREE|nr:FAD-linked oxidoreductase-like protein [Kockovaella imperatae]ORX38636.1 FAD-linked oxidoreductase-like protein [Kockovaella imperatae]
MVTLTPRSAMPLSRALLNPMLRGPAYGTPLSRPGPSAFRRSHTSTPMNRTSAATTTATTSTSSSSVLSAAHGHTIPSIQVFSTPALLRSYFVYSLCSFPFIIDNAPRILSILSKAPMPGLKALTEWGIRHTFFAQFVPGETVEECTRAMKTLRERGVGAVLNYSAEVEEDVAAASAVPLSPKAVAGGPGGTDGSVGPASTIPSSTADKARALEKQRLDEVFRALRASGIYEDDIEAKSGAGARGSTGFALKITGLIDPAILQRASTTLLRLRYSESSKATSAKDEAVPYPGTPASGDARVLASLPGSTDQSIFKLEGAVPSMGVLASDEGVRPSDLEEMHSMWEKLCKMGEEAKANGVRLMIDAEHTWYQPALDAYTLLLCEKFNRPPKDGNWSGPLIYGTFQSYLVRQLTHLPAAIQHAKDNGYALGLKVVRGAYFLQERKKWKDEGREGADPIWKDKSSTDKSYNWAVTHILSTLSEQLKTDPAYALAVVFGTHNPDSVDLIFKGLKDNGLAKEVEGGKLRMREDVKGRVGIAQLYGMKDDLMDKAVESFEPSNQPIALKYIAYGKLDEVIPFLGRRAIENKSLMSGEGGAAAEKKRIWEELVRRYFGQEPVVSATQ